MLCDDIHKMIIYSYFIAQAIVQVCATASWNQTFTTLAGSQSTIGSTSTLFSYPTDIGFDGYRNMYVADNNNHRIQKFPSGLYKIFD
jgi:hypothetical protein